ncbi:hypothetical protein BKA69DRAFT_932049 [Paraphysoderma sedebokerense]|nr:hypothetical protein BKA69DRAFT_932049 [Paraphysoderma sedebokerense]
MSLTVSLRNFYDDSAPAVWIGDFPCSSDTPAIDGIFHCPIPEGGGANLPVIIEHYSVPSFTSFNFSYEPPVVDSISPTTASTEGPITFTIVGSKFGYCGTPFTSPCGSIIYFKLINITIGDRACLRIRHTNTSLSCTVPRGVAGMDLDVVVAYYGQNSSTNSSPKFSSFPPVISKTSKRRILLSSDDPSSSLLEIEGLNLGPPNTKASVIFIANNGTNFPVCNTSVSMNHTWLRCEILRNLPSPHLYNVSVLVAGQYSNSDTQIFYGNFPPIPNPTDITTDEDNVYQVALAGMDSDGDPVEVFLTELPLNGTLYQFDARYPNAKGIPVDFDGAMDGKVIDHLGRVVYAPNPNFCGSDNFSFIVADRVNNVYTNSTPLTVPITVNSIPDPPVVSNIAVSVQEDSNVIINIAITDVDTPLPGVSVVIDTLPGHGEISYMLDSTASVYITAVPFTIPPGNHSIKYAPRPNYFGADQFAYYVNDGLNDSTIAVVTISVQSVNDKPASLSQSITMMEDQGCTIPFKVDDVDQPATVKQRIKITSWNHTLGNLYQVNSNGLKYGSPLGSNVDVTDNFNRLWFQPNPNEYGTVNLEFTATDELNAVSDSASISITIEPINDAPHILDCKGEILLNSTLKIGPTIIDITSVVKDADVGEQFSFELVEAPQKGKLLLEGNTVDVGTRYLINTSALANGEVPIVLNYQILPQGGGNPFANFTYRLFDNAGVSTELCTVKFTIKCPPPLVNNVFKENSGDICEPCPSGAMCSEDGRYPPYAAPGYWKNENTNGLKISKGAFSLVRRYV